VTGGNGGRQQGDRETDRQRVLRDAIEAGPLSLSPEPVLASLLAASVQVPLAARMLYLAEGDVARPALVVEGLLRADIAAPDGRQVTVAYMRAGDLIGFAAFFGGPHSARILAATDALLLAFAPAEVERIMETDPANVRLFARVVTRRMYVGMEELALHVFGTLRERVSHHLLDVAMGIDGEGPLIAQITQQELANATGAARESVARVLRELETEGLIERKGSRIALRRPLLLHPAHRHWQEHRMPVV
jgi:CRP/FNR family transcriptional regulator